MTPLTIALIVALGAYMLASGIGIARNPAQARNVISELKSSAALTIITGAFTFALGAAVIMAHNKWGNFLEGFVSLVGWSAAGQGLLLLAAPGLIFSLAETLAPSDRMARLFGVITLTVGACLLFIGLPILSLFASPV